jgi:phosphate/sulfate permease
MVLLIQLLAVAAPHVLFSVRSEMLAAGSHDVAALTSAISKLKAAEQSCSADAEGTGDAGALAEVRSGYESISELLQFEPGDLAKYKKALDESTQFIPTWVKVCIAIALGLGTMVGWKRIVITVGEKIGKSHLTYAQGAAAEITAMGTIGLADGFGLPVSTTHVLSSGVTGAMAANGSGVQMSTIRSLLLAWVLTLPCAITLSACLFYIFRQIF